MHSHTLFDYPRHNATRVRDIPLDGVPSIPLNVAKRWHKWGENKPLTELELQQCDDAIEAACHVLQDRELKLK